MYGQSRSPVKEQERRCLCQPPPPVAHTSGEINVSQQARDRWGLLGTARGHSHHHLSADRGGLLPQRRSNLHFLSAVLTLLRAQHVKRQAVPQIKRDCYCVSNPLRTAEVPARSCASCCSHLLRHPAGWSCSGGNRLSVNYPDCSGRTDDTAAHLSLIHI